jgi:integrase
MRRPEGKVKKLNIKSPAKWRASISYTDPETNKRVDVRRRFETEGEARRHLWEIQRQLGQKGTIEKTIKQLTVAEVAQRYNDERLVPPVMRNGQQVGGRHNVASPRVHLQVIVAAFGKRKIKSLTYGDLARFRAQRLQTLTKYGKPRSVRTVNAELATLRVLMTFALHNGWIEIDPFTKGEPLIRVSEEAERERTLSYEEERRLLAVCVAERAHLRPLIVTALETGLRRGVLLRLTWPQVDFATGYLRLGKPKSKRKNHPEQVKMTSLLQLELQRWREQASPQQSLVFGVTVTFHTAWKKACDLAQLEDLHFHDLRHTFATRSISAGVPAAEVMKGTGHSSLDMLSRYVNPADASEKIADALDAWRQQQGGDFSLTSDLVN